MVYKWKDSFSYGAQIDLSGSVVGDLFSPDARKTAKVNRRHISNNKIANIKEKNLKVYKGVYGRQFIYKYHKTKTAKIQMVIILCTTLT